MLSGVIPGEGKPFLAKIPAPRESNNNDKVITNIVFFIIYIFIILNTVDFYIIIPFLQTTTCGKLIKKSLDDEFCLGTKEESAKITKEGLLVSAKGEKKLSQLYDS